MEAEFRRDEAREAAEFDEAPDAGEPEPESETGNDAESAKTQADAPPRPAELFPDILGWQPIVLNRDFECGRCHRALRAGESAFLGLAAGGGISDTALCGRCTSGRR